MSPSRSGKLRTLAGPCAKSPPSPGVLPQGRPMIGALTYLHPVFFVFCGGHFEFVMRGQLVQGLKLKFKKAGTGRKIRKFSEELMAY